jgi:hypothetical protein
MIPFIFRTMWRFFTGLHMDGRRRHNSSGSVLPQYSGYFWNRYGRKRKAFIRHLSFWLALGMGYGLLFQRHITEYAILAVTPFIIWWISSKILNALTQVTKFHDGDGVMETYRIVRPKVRCWITSHKPSKWRVSLPDGGPVPPEIARAILAENAEDNGEPIMGMRLPKAVPGGNNEGKLPARKGRNPYRRAS